METNFNFKSQPCTSIEQSNRLLALGLKKETADMYLQSTLNDVWSPYIPIAIPYSKVEAFNSNKDVFRIIPAWSLGRLWEILPHTIMYNDVMYYKRLRHAGVIYNSWHINNDIIISQNSSNPYETLIDAIEWLIKNGFHSAPTVNAFGTYFNKTEI